MRLNVFGKLAMLPVVAFAFTCPLLASQPASRVAPHVMESENWNTEAETSKLLKEVQSLTRQLKTDAETLESLTRSKIGWQSHASQLSQVRGHINVIGKRLDRLQSIQPASSPMQQRAIDQVVPVAVEVAARTESAIRHLSENQTDLNAPAYVTHLRVISQQSGEMKQTVDTFLDFAKTQQKLDQLQQRIELIES